MGRQPLPGQELADQVVIQFTERCIVNVLWTRLYPKLLYSIQSVSRKTFAREEGEIFAKVDALLRGRTGREYCPIVSGMRVQTLPEYAHNIYRIKKKMEMMVLSWAFNDTIFVMDLAPELP
ncbi:hypothetical protein QFZ77_003221 [Paenibacillus sp. V4I3]|uniref:hypothetical protein n=1 Tax=unclassified Paenibacillus TaxID=185978 RepID=UPI00278A9F06|nr:MULTISPECIES: hypothetical protein [unclassified Paenibacillus]MDQ0874562.1 hypothetical protein [Paenibacillus sp. V4I3]MDQ0889686.1 hypothetical protein [Paenibacillus sp. V4I9]